MKDFFSPFLQGRLRPFSLSLACLVVLTLILFTSYSLFSMRYAYVKVRGESMLPTFEPGDHLILRTTPEAEVGEYILFKLPERWKDRWQSDDSATLIKRVALAPGDELSWDGRAWRRNGEEFSSVSSGTCPIEPMRYVLGEGEYFVTGDTTTSQTMDSREGFCFDLGFLISKEEVEAFGEVVRKF